MQNRPASALTPLAVAAFLTLAAAATQAQTAAGSASTTGTLQTVTVNASADASAEGLSKPYAGGQVARGGRIGFLGTQDYMDTPFAVTSYTNELIQNQQARSVADVLKNDPSVRVARGFGNFQESYFIRGFLLGSDEIAYNGLYSLLPRQYVASELFERVEVLRGASTFLTGAAPGGGGIGGTINLMPKRAGNEDLNQVNLSTGTGGQKGAGVDLSRRFGPDGATGVRLNAAHHEGGTGVDREQAKLDVFAVGLDWHSRDLRLSADIGYQNNKLSQTRTNVTPGVGLTSIPRAPDSTANWAQPWSYSNERDTFGTLRAEYDFNSQVTGWAAYGGRRSTEANSLANLTVNDASTGAGTTYRADNYRKDDVDSAEAGLRARLQTGAVGHTLVASASTYRLDSRNAYAWSPIGGLATNLYSAPGLAMPATTGFTGGVLSNPLTTTRNQFDSFAIGDTLSFLDDTVLLTLGVRHQSIDTRGYNYNTGAQTDSYDKSRTSPVVGGVWKLRKDVSVYANYIESLAAATAAPSTAVNVGQLFSPYVSKQKEIGVKYDGGTLGAGAAYFTTKKPSGYLDPTSKIYSVAGEDRHQGVELTAFGEPMRGLKVLGGVTFLDAKQESTAGGATNGKKVIGVPDAQANIGVEWAIPGVRGLAVDSQLITTGKFYADAANTLKVPGWTRLDLGVRYTTEVMGRAVTLRGRINNVADRSYWASAGGYSGNGYLVLGAPRTAVLSATFDF
ncbi:TonB-dependent siderophore receptor [Xylophilus rhododendri]|uniref:TonB-dependent siderophore receptor n=1 Tax=Xylophilus rhododendri TaxID=2697032 RepID=A0A857J7S7_9BURK|nr:TonB-dependent receptor [Xylophilus rhododendri]QHJ00025.1 TonB-dependent siderophore receptor [Xylophilus rhododendri]